MVCTLEQQLQWNDSMRSCDCHMLQLWPLLVLKITLSKCARMDVCMCCVLCTPELQDLIHEYWSYSGQVQCQVVLWAGYDQVSLLQGDCFQDLISNKVRTHTMGSGCVHHYTIEERLIECQKGITIFNGILDQTGSVQDGLPPCFAPSPRNAFTDS